MFEFAAIIQDKPFLIIAILCVVVWACSRF